MDTKKIKKVNFDMDGVLVDFDQSLQNFSGLSSEQILNSRKLFKSGKIDSDPILSLMHQNVKLGLFEEAPETPEAAIFFEMMDWLEKNGIGVEILSSVTGESFGDLAIEQKRIWLKKRDRDRYKQNYTKGASNKIFFAESDSLLIDDYIKNVKIFNDNGSQAIHHYDIAETIKNFKEYFPKFEIEQNKNLLYSLMNKTVLDYEPSKEASNLLNNKQKNKRKMAF